MFINLQLSNPLCAPKCYIYVHARVKPILASDVRASTKHCKNASTSALQTFPIVFPSAFSCFTTFSLLPFPSSFSSIFFVCLWALITTICCGKWAGRGQLISLISVARVWRPKIQMLCGMRATGRCWLSVAHTHLVCREGGTGNY